MSTDTVCRTPRYVDDVHAVIILQVLDSSSGIMCKANVQVKSRRPAKGSRTSFPSHNLRANITSLSQNAHTPCCLPSSHPFQAWAELLLSLSFCNANLQQSMNS